jgi:hypothetical protein
VRRFVDDAVALILAGVVLLSGASKALAMTHESPHVARIDSDRLNLTMSILISVLTAVAVPVVKEDVEVAVDTLYCAWSERRRKQRTRRTFAAAMENVCKGSPFR